MKLELSPVYKDSYNCMQSALATMAKHFKFEYRIGFLNCWNFHYNTMSDTSQFTTISDKLFIIDEIVENVLIGFEKYQGIKFLKSTFYSVDDLKSFVITILSEGKPIVFLLDNYWCPWSITYKKYHVLHSFLINGVDLELNAFICIDPYFQTVKQKLFWSEMPNIKYTCYSLQSIERIENLGLSMLSEKNDEVLGKKDTELSYSDQIRIYAEELKYLDTEQERGKSASIDTIPLMRKLKEIENSRINYGEALLQINNQLEIDSLENIANELTELSSLWGKHRYVLIKYFMLPGNSKLLSQAINTAYECAIMEEKIGMKMNDILYNN